MEGVETNKKGPIEWPKVNLKRINWKGRGSHNYLSWRQTEGELINPLVTE